MAAPAVKIVTDEQENAIQKMVDDRVKAALAIHEGRTPGVSDPRQTPNYKSWQKGLGASPIGEGSGEVSDGGNYSDFRGVIREMLESPQFKAFQSRGTKVMEDFVPTNKSIWGDRSQAGVHLPSGYVEREIVSRAAQMTGVSDGRTVAGTQYDATIHIKPNRVLHVRDLMNVVSVTEGSVKFLQEVGFTDGTIMMPENVDPASTTSITNSTMGLQLVTTDMKQISTKIEVPDQYLEDVDQIQAFLEMRLDEIGFDKEDAQILSGDGTGNNFKGFYPDSACQALLWSDCEVGDTEIDAFLNAMVLAWLVNIEPDGSVAHPQVWAKFARAKDSTKRYLIDGVHSTNPQKLLWGKPVALSNAAPTGKVLVGSFATNAVLYDRMTPTIYASRDHGTNRDKNLTSFFLNRRAGVAKFRPEGFVRLTFDSAPV